MKKVVLENKTTINCISILEAQMLEMHVSGYFTNNITIQNGDTIVDVGANIGLFGHRLSEQYKNLTIIDLEPIKYIFEVLKENVKLSKNNNYKIFPYGLSNKNEFKKIIYYPNGTAMSTFNPEIWENNNQLLLAFKGTMEYAPKIWWWAKFIPRYFYPIAIYWLKKGSENIVCELKTLSYIIEKNSLKEINLLKIDCEGNELKVLEGVGNKHWKLIKQIIIEVHDIDDRYKKISSILTKEGFKLKILKEQSLKETNLLNIYASR